MTSREYPLGEKLLLREVKTNEGYALGEERIVMITKVQEHQDEKVMQTEKIVNFRLSEISIEKICGDGTNRPMDDVTFELWKKGDEGRSDELLLTGKTDKDGKLSFLVGEGEYYLMEADVGHWTSFRVLEEPIRVTCGKEGKVHH